MAGILSAQNFRFLFREDKGNINRYTWWVATAALAAVLAIVGLLAAALILTAGNVSANAATAQESITLLSILTQGVYLTAIFHILIILVFVCYYFVSAKRYNDLGKSPKLGLILPAALYLLIVSPILVDQVLPVFGRWIMAVLFAAVALWQVYELGFRKGQL
jgi:uncharacterized membrane protein YhaH (DUF805 family)